MAKGLKTQITGLLYWMDTSEKAKISLAIIQLLTGMFAFMVKGGVFVEIAQAGFYITWGVVFIFLLALLKYSGKYKVIKFKYNKNTGTLYDELLNERNVSLRAESLNLILDSLAIDKLSEVGRAVGRNFYASFAEYERRKENTEVTAEKMLDKWQEYDSSSGMGLFSVIREGLTLKIVITNPFIGECDGSTPNPRCDFIKGYLEGFFEELTKDSKEIKCVTINFGDRKCICTIS